MRRRGTARSSTGVAISARVDELLEVRVGDFELVDPEVGQRHRRGDADLNDPPGTKTIPGATSASGVSFTDVRPSCGAHFERLVTGLLTRTR